MMRDFIRFVGAILFMAFVVLVCLGFYYALYQFLSMLG